MRFFEKNQEASRIAFFFDNIKMLRSTVLKKYLKKVPRV